MWGAERGPETREERDLDGKREEGNQKRKMIQEGSQEETEGKRGWEENRRRIQI